MDTKIVRTIRDRMQEKSTQELVEIWTQNDRTQWTEYAFEAIRQLLEERGYPIPPQQPPKLEEPQGQGSKPSGFWTFRTMISGEVIKVLWFIGIVGLLVVGYRVMDRGDFSAAAVASGLAIIVFGNLLWRVVCESWILFFSIREILASIEENLRRR